MIKIENASTAGLEPAVRGMRNPMNSWERSDSQVCKCGDGFEDCCIEVHGDCPRGDEDYFKEDVFCIGKDDFELMQRLAKAGTDHRKYMRMIVVYADITAPLYWWKEADQYKVGTATNSCSTMHKIHADEFNLADFSHEHLIADVEEAGYEILVDGEQCTDIFVTPKSMLMLTVGCLNNYRKKFLETKDKKWWRQMIQLLPSSYNQRRTIMLNYEVLANIYHARKNHKLDEWRQFCKWIESLPYSEIITGAKNGVN